MAESREQSINTIRQETIQTIRRIDSKGGKVYVGTITYRERNYGCDVSFVLCTSRIEQVTNLFKWPSRTKKYTISVDDENGENTVQFMRNDLSETLETMQKYVVNEQNQNTTK